MAIIPISSWKVIASPYHSQRAKLFDSFADPMRLNTKLVKEKSIVHIAAPFSMALCLLDYS